MRASLEGANMVFITAGMGGGTGTGAAPVIAKAARDRGILTVGVVTKPFHFEGAHRMRSAEAGLKDMEDVVDTLIVIPNQNLFRIANEKTTFAEAFRMADGVLQSGVRGVTDLMVMPGLINLDFNDIRNVMEEMGKAMMGTGESEGEGRAIKAAEAAINNPLLDDVSMRGARGVIINITGGYDMTLFEVDEACNHIRDQVDPDANIIFGSTFDERIKGSMRVSVVATGIDQPMAARQRPATSGAVAARATATVAEGGAAPAAPFGYSPATAQVPQQQYQQPSQPMTQAPQQYAAPQAYSPTIKAPAAAFTIPSAPAEPAPVYQAPEQLPLMPAAARQDFFIPPVPAVAERNPVVQQPDYTAAQVAPEPVYTAPAPVAARPAPSAPRLPNMETVDEFDDRPARGRAPSIFDRLRSMRGHATAAPAAPQASTPAQRAAPTMRRASPATAQQPTLDIEARPLAVASVAAVEDDLDIPAFLRRQAN